MGSTARAQRSNVRELMPKKLPTTKRRVNYRHKLSRLGNSIKLTLNSIHLKRVSLKLRSNSLNLESWNSRLRSRPKIRIPSKGRFPPRTSSRLPMKRPKVKSKPK